MAIPKRIIQTYKTDKLPWLARWHIEKLKHKNPNYTYEFYDDERIEDFLMEEFETQVWESYQKINIGAAKADFFRYAVLYKKGGVYLDVDSLIVEKLDNFILADDEAIISLESNKKYYVQYALFFNAQHLFLEKTMEVIMDNIKNNRFAYDVHKMTGPSAYSLAVDSVIKSEQEVNYRQVGIDYENKVKFSFPMSKTAFYGFTRKNHWKKMSKTKTVLK